MSVGTWTRFSAVPVRSLYRRPQSRQQKRRKPWTLPLAGRRRVAMRAVHDGSLDLSKMGSGTYPLVTLSASCPES